MADATEYTNKSRVIHIGPCKVKAVHLAGDGERADAQVYDGVTTNAEQKAHLEVVESTSYTWVPGDGTRFNNGIFIGVSGSGAKVTVTFEPLFRKVLD